MSDYTFAVGKIRALENGLLGKSAFDRMTDARNLNEAVEVLTSFGWDISAADYEKRLSERLTSVYDELKTLSDGSAELDTLLFENDYQNIKFALKSLVVDENVPDSYVYPTNVDIKLLGKVLEDKSFENLPALYRADVENAYTLLTETMDGQLLDMFLDKCVLKRYRACAEATDNQVLKEYLTLKTDYADIKIAYRCAVTKKRFEFIYDALCESDALDIEALAKSAEKGKNDLLAYLSETEFSSVCEVLNEGGAAFEKYSDEQVLKALYPARFDAFGVSALIAFYLMNEAEIRTVRIILVCKAMGVEPDSIRERVRDTGV